MKISAAAHAVLDYLTVVMFAVAPTVLGLAGASAALCYALAAVHFALTLTTAFPGGLLQWIPLKWHGWIEAVVGPTLLAVPWVLGFDSRATAFFVLAGLLVCAVWWLSDYAGWYASRT
jgi:hypothetical protein